MVSPGLWPERKCVCFFFEERQQLFLTANWVCSPTPFPTLARTLAPSTVAARRHWPLAHHVLFREGATLVSPHKAISRKSLMATRGRSPRPEGPRLPTHGTGAAPPYTHTDHHPPPQRKQLDSRTARQEADSRQAQWPLRNVGALRHAGERGGCRRGHPLQV